ncbi:flagellar export protein FliJ [Massilibacterium senegalense]|uniref:flagellar export protein FliJ n=1 Tax=Massilibacterium senegalense TaxID=1632858 RepID=UPI000780DD6F|nr:flagellar export protein FliJ [Massilibacterium senegalense]
MKYEYGLEKVLTIKEKEKQTVANEYEKARESFQKRAMQLYEQLKKKEQLEEERQALLKKGIIIRDLQQNQFFLHKIEDKIAETEEKVNEARTHMQVKQQMLVYKNIEMKKYEKMKEKEKLAYLKQQKQEEERLMDEISIQQYMNDRK